MMYYSWVLLRDFIGSLFGYTIIFARMLSYSLAKLELALTMVWFLLELGTMKSLNYIATWRIYNSRIAFPSPKFISGPGLSWELLLVLTDSSIKLNGVFGLLFTKLKSWMSFFGKFIETSVLIYTWCLVYNWICLIVILHNFFSGSFRTKNCLCGRSWT